MVEVTLSAPNMVKLLKLTHQPRFVTVDRAIAKRVYEQIAKVIDAIDPDAAPGRDIPPVVLDDKLGEAHS